MRFEKQAQELLMQNLTPRGVVRYTSRGWYCLTDHDFILHAEFYKERQGYFSIRYEAVPLIVPLGCFFAGELYIPGEKDAGNMFSEEIGLDPLNYTAFLKCKELSEPLTADRCVRILTDFVDVYFSKLTDVQTYYDENQRQYACAVQYHRLKFPPLSEEKARELMETKKRWEESPAGKAFRKHNPPCDTTDARTVPTYPSFPQWLGDDIYFFICARLGLYEEGVKCFANSTFVQMKNDTSDALNDAMLHKDAQRCNEILQQIQQSNYALIRQTLDIDIAAGSTT